jgi:phthalate 4,5-dioxygenase reductase subunit
MVSESDEWRALRVDVAEFAARDIMRFVLRDPQGSALPAFEAGAHLRVRTPSGLERKYSLANDPADRDGYEIAVLRDGNGRGGSADMVDHLKAGDLIDVSEPRNDFGLAKSSAGYLFIAGGIGITPILSMIRHLASEGETRFKLVYLTRSAAQTAFAEVLAEPAFATRVTLHHDGGDPDEACDLWPLLERPGGRHLYCCGPAGLMTAVRDMTGHWPASSVHFEAFADSTASQTTDEAFFVQLARSGARLEVPPGVSILEAMREAGHDCPSSCESGSCGTCRTELLEGEVDHRDFVLAGAERMTHIMICVSRAAAGSELVIDR